MHNLHVSSLYFFMLFLQQAWVQKTNMSLNVFKVQMCVCVCVHVHLELLKDGVGERELCGGMRSSSPMIYVTHVVTYAPVTSPTSPLTAWIMHVPTKKKNDNILHFLPSHPLFYKVYFIITDPWRRGLCVCLCRVCPSLPSVPASCADYLPGSIQFNKFSLSRPCFTKLRYGKYVHVCACFSTCHTRVWQKKE